MASEPWRRSTAWPLLLVLATLMCPGRAVGDEVPEDPAARLAAAEQAFNAGRYKEALGEAARVPAGDPLSDRAQFLRAYAHLKLKQPEAAARLLDPLLERAFSSEAALLRGMVSMEQHRWREAILKYEEVVKARESPWDTTAQKLIDRIHQEQATRTRRLSRAKELRSPRHPPAPARTKQRSAPGDPRLSLSLETATGLDTNPAYLDESPAAQESASFAFQASGRLGLRRWFFKHLGGSLGLRLLERVYMVGVADAEQTEVSPRLTVLVRVGQFTLDASYLYALALYGHAPLLSRHTGRLQAAYRPLPWLRLSLEGRICRHPVHDNMYSYLDGIEAGGVLGGSISRGRLGLGVFYEVLRDWADTVEAQVANKGAGNTKGKGGGSSGSGGQAAAYTLITNYSFTGHGPSLWSSVMLPWRLALRARVGLQWRTFDSTDTLSEVGSTTTVSVEPRQDLRLSLVAELSRALPHDLELALSYESLDSFSSVSLTEQGLDRNYSRRMASLALRWRLVR